MLAHLGIESVKLSVVSFCCIATNNYTYTYACEQNHNDDTIKTSDTVL